MVDKHILENVLRGLGITQPRVDTALPVLLGQATGASRTGLIDLKQACVYLGGISRWTVQRAIESGKLPCVRIGTRILFDIPDLDCFIRTHKVRAVAKCRKNNQKVSSKISPISGLLSG